MDIFWWIVDSASYVLAVAIYSFVLIGLMGVNLSLRKNAYRHPRLFSLLYCVILALLGFSVSYWIGISYDVVFWSVMVAVVSLLRRSLMARLEVFVFFSASLACWVCFY